MVRIQDDTSSVYLQDITLDDVSDEYLSWLCDPEINRYLETRFQDQTIASIKSFVQSTINSPTEYLFTIRVKESNQHIGNIKLGAINNYHGIADVSLFIGNKSFWGRGIATEAIQLIGGFAFNQLTLRKLCAGAYDSNKGSTKAFIKAGWQLDGIKKAHCLDQGQPCDVINVCLFNTSNS